MTPIIGAAAVGSLFYNVVSNIRANQSESVQNFASKPADTAQKSNGTETNRKIARSLV